MRTVELPQHPEDAARIKALEEEGYQFWLEASPQSRPFVTVEIQDNPATLGQEAVWFLSHEAHGEWDRRFRELERIKKDESVATMADSELAAYLRENLESKKAVNEALARILSRP